MEAPFTTYTSAVKQSLELAHVYTICSNIWYKSGSICKDPLFVVVAQTLFSKVWLLDSAI